MLKSGSHRACLQPAGDIVDWRLIDEISFQLVVEELGLQYRGLTSAVGDKLWFGPHRRYDRATPESRPSSGCVRFLGLEVRSPSDSQRRWARSARTGYDPERIWGIARRFGVLPFFNDG